MEQPDGKWQGGSRIRPGLLKKVVQEEMGSTWTWLIFLSFFVLKTKWIFFTLVLSVFDERRLLTLSEHQC